jgi:hypothetical protein
MLNSFFMSFNAVRTRWFYFMAIYLANILAVLFTQVILFRVISIETIIIGGDRCSRFGNEVAQYKPDESADTNHNKFRNFCCGENEIKLHSIGVDDQEDRNECRKGNDE